MMPSDSAIGSDDEQYALTILACEHSQSFGNIGIDRDRWNIMIRDIPNTPRFPFACGDLAQRCHGDSSDGLLVLENRINNVLMMSGDAVSKITNRRTRLN